jgi:hypothetical protein
MSSELARRLAHELSAYSMRERGEEKHVRAGGATMFLLEMLAAQQTQIEELTECLYEAGVLKRPGAVVIDIRPEA